MLMAAGTLVAGMGLSDVTTAWWEQWQAGTTDVTATIPEAHIFPPGYVGKLAIPRLRAAIYVVNMKQLRDLRMGPGYIPGSAQPGQKGNCIIAGHRDLHFRILKDIRVGDEIDLESTQGRFSYRVASTQIVSASNNAVLRPAYVRQLTLVTCYPFYYLGPAPKRFIVKAVLSGN